MSQSNGFETAEFAATGSKPAAIKAAEETKKLRRFDILSYFSKLDGRVSLRSNSAAARFRFLHRMLGLELLSELDRIVNSRKDASIWLRFARY